MDRFRCSKVVHPAPMISVLLVLLSTSALRGASARAVIVGIVLCDRCRDGRRSLFDSPVPGAKVAVTCDDPSGDRPAYAEATTSWLGSYTVRIKGEPDLSSCTARVVSAPSWCFSTKTDVDEAQQPPRRLNLVFRAFGKELYTVPPLLSSPSAYQVAAGGLCIRNVRSPPSPPPPPPPSPPQSLETPVPEPPAGDEESEPLRPPSPPMAPPSTTTEETAASGAMPSPPKKTPPPPAKTPQHSVPNDHHHINLPRIPKPHPPHRSFACPFEKWMNPEYTCRWVAMDPDTTVAAAFGPIAARRYGRNATLWEGLFGKGEPYGTLLREATTALLNSYAAGAGGFMFSPTMVVHKTNAALLGTPRQMASAAIKFRRANTGDRKYGAGKCGLRPCIAPAKP